MPCRAATKPAAQNSAAPTPHTLYLGTAPVVGVYFPAGGAICAMVNRHRAETGLRCVIESTDGSIAPTCSYFPQSASLPRSLPPGASVTAVTMRHS